jgi:predicted alpha/beta hydrolase
MSCQDMPATQNVQSRSPTLAATPGEPFKESAADGYVLGGFTWRHASPDTQRPVVIINAATSVRCRHYSRFAAYLFANGFDVMTYDYRGIGESRSVSIKGLNASWTDWGALDFEAMLKRAQREFPGQPIDVVGHSFGGCAAGLGESGRVIRRLVTVGAQFAYWRDYAPEHRWRMFGKWHVLMPLLTLLLRLLPRQATRLAGRYAERRCARLEHACRTLRTAPKWSRTDEKDRRAALRQRPRANLGHQHQRRSLRHNSSHRTPARLLQ